MRLAQSVNFMKVQIDPAEPLPAKDYFVVKDIFTTFDGSWELGGNIFAVPGWARSEYLKPAGAADRFDDAGGATHLFVRVEDGAGQPLHADIVFKTTAGLTVRANTFQDGKRSGWCNLFMTRDSAFDPNKSEQGPWSVAVDAVPSDLVMGLGLPFRWHVSTFIVFQRKRESGEVVVVPPPVDDIPTRLTRLEGEFAELRLLVMGLLRE